MIANGGCPCPGIGDAALGLSDAILHFFYNAVAYAGLVYAYLVVLRSRPDRPSSRLARRLRSGQVLGSGR